VAVWIFSRWPPAAIFNLIQPEMAPLMLKCIWVTVLTLLGHVTSSVTWPLACPWATSYRCSIGTDTLSPRDFEMLRLKCIWVTVLTFLGHVTSSVAWPFFPRYAVSYRWSVDTSFLTGTVTEIFGCKGPINAMSSQACVFPYQISSQLSQGLGS